MGSRERGEENREYGIQNSGDRSQETGVRIGRRKKSGEVAGTMGLPFPVV
jgi:hypothetical protein